MAHTPRQADEKREHPAAYPVGTIVGMHTEDGEVHGRITDVDGGGWIYVDWEWDNIEGKAQNALPGYLRSTHCFLVENKEPDDPLAAIKEHCQKTHDDRAQQPMRYGYWTMQSKGKKAKYNYDESGNYYTFAKKPQRTSGGCFAGIQAYLSELYGEMRYVYACSHGDGAPISWKGICDTAVFNEEIKAHRQPFNVFKGTERSKKWMEFIMSSASPWRLLHNNIVEKDLNYLNNAGFIFGDISTLPRKLAYNLVMAIRYPWEMPRNYSFWLELVKSGIDPATALFLSNFITPVETAKDIDGPYEVIYPWSFLESARLDCAHRFITGKPKDVGAKGTPCSPNVFPLWQTQLPTNDADWKALLAEKELSLQTALRYVNEAVEKQGQYL